MATDERFWANVDKQGAVPDHRPELGPCWLWLGAKTPKGYGRVRRKPRLLLAHRYAYELTKTEPPPDLDVCHHCDVPWCVNPAHLFLGTRSENMLDASNKGRLNAQKPGYLAPRMIGQQNGLAALTAEQVLEVRSRRAGGEKVAVLAKDYSVHKATISRVSRGLQRAAG